MRTYASELCRMGVVDYVLTEDMDTMAYGCPKLIRKCVDKNLKRKDIISVFDYKKVIQGINLSHDKFIDFVSFVDVIIVERLKKWGTRLS